MEDRNSRPKGRRRSTLAITMPTRAPTPPTTPNTTAELKGEDSAGGVPGMTVVPAQSGREMQAVEASKLRADGRGITNHTRFSLCSIPRVQPANIDDGNAPVLNKGRLAREAAAQHCADRPIETIVLKQQRPGEGNQARTWSHRDMGMRLLWKNPCSPSCKHSIPPHPRQGEHTHTAPHSPCSCPVAAPQPPLTRTALPTPTPYLSCVKQSSDAGNDPTRSLKLKSRCVRGSLP